MVLYKFMLFYSNQISTTEMRGPRVPVRVSSVFMPPLLGIGGIRFYPCLYAYIHPTFGFHSVLYETNHLRFMHMVRNFKRQSKFDFGL